MAAKAFGGRLTSPFDLALTAEIYALFADNGEGFPLGLKISALLFRLLASVTSFSDAPERDKPDVVFKAVELIENGYHKPIEISAPAYGLGMSRSYFTAVFTAAMGVSPYRFLTSCRMQRATGLLARSPRLTVEEIAYSCGFSSIERFSSTFKKYFGLSPSKYRATLNKL